MNFRSYDAKKRARNLKWLNALAGTWTDLGRRSRDTLSRTVSRSRVAGYAFTRATYTNISSDHFTWRGDRSNHGKMWEHFLTIELYRSEKLLRPVPSRDEPG